MSSSDLTPFSTSSKKYGYKNKNGEVVIEPVYDLAQDFSEGLAAVNLGHRKGEGRPDRDGHPETIIISDGKWGFINEKGEVIIPIAYSLAHSFSEGLAAVNLGYETGDGVLGGDGYSSTIILNNGKWGFINKNNEVVIPLIYNWVSPFSEGLAYVSGEIFIDKKGKETISLKGKSFAFVGGFKNGFALIGPDNGLYGYLDRTGKVVVPPIFTQATIEQTPIEQLIALAAQELILFTVDEKWGYKNRLEEIVIPATFNTACGFSDDMALVERDGQWFYINKDGSQATPYLPYNHTENFVNGYAKVRSGKFWGYIDKTGTEVIPTIYDLVDLQKLPIKELLDKHKT